jgi:hypothetical protein
MFPPQNAVPILIAVSAAVTIKSPAVVGTGTRHPVTVCVEELHQQIDAKFTASTGDRESP